MRTLTSTLVPLGILGLLGCQTQPGVPLPLVADSSTAVYQSSNLQVIHRFNDASEVVAVRLYLLGGTRQLTEENAGIELLLLQAAGLEHGHTITRTGSHRTLESTPDWTVIGFVGLRKDVDSAWSGFARQLGRPTFSDTSLERARGALVTLARRRYTQPDLRIHSGARQAAFLGHPYALDPEGTVASLGLLSRTDLERYWEQHFVTSRMLLVVVGAITRRKIDSLIAMTIGRLPVGEYEWTLPPPLPPRPSYWVREHQDLPTNYILGYFGGPRPTDQDYFPFRAAVALLSSQLSTQLREEESLTYTASAPFLDHALPIGGIYTSTSNPAEAIRLIRRSLGEYKQPLIPWGYEPGWWHQFLDGFVLEELLTRMTSEGQAETLARAHLYFDDPGMADQYVRRLRQVNFWQLPDIARRYMQGIQWAYMGDTAQMRGHW